MNLNDSKPKSSPNPGGGQTFRVGSDSQSESIQNFLAAALGVSKRQVKALLDERRVFVNKKRAWVAKFVLNAGDIVEVQGDVGGAATPPEIQVVFDSPALYVVNKPAGLLSVGSDSVEEMLRKAHHAPDLWVAHRLDRDTTGCLLVAKSRSVFETLIEQFKRHQVAKSYRAIVRGTVKSDVFTIDTPIDGRTASTEVEVVQRNNFASEIIARPITGRLHQIRRHMAEIGHPVVGDKQYEFATIKSAALRIVGRQMLHAAQISLVVPEGTGKPTTIEANEPEDFMRLRGELFGHGRRQ